MHCESKLIKQLKQQLNQLQKQRIGIRKMRALEDISREEFLQDYEEMNTKIASLQMKIQDFESTLPIPDSPNIDLSRIKRILNSWLDADAANVPNDLIEQFVQQVIVMDDNTFYWILNFPFPLSASLRSNPKPHALLGTDYESAKPKPLFSFTVTKDDARAYCRLIGMKFIGKKWTDKKIILA